MLEKNVWRRTFEDEHLEQTMGNKRDELFKRITGQVRKALHDYDMIQSGDRLAVGLSGGKDSLTLLTALARLREYYLEKFEIEAVTIDLGFDVSEFGSDSKNGLTEYCNSLGIRHTVEKTHIGEVVFEYKPEENPCSLCANMRRGALNSTAKVLNCNKVALAHNRDDIVETMLLSLFYEGRISTFSPVTFLDRAQLHVLRPLIYTEEGDIVSYARLAPFSIVKNECPMNGVTRRQYAKELLKELSSGNKHIKSNIFGAIKRDILKPPLV